LNITGDELAKLAHVSVNRLREFENGKYEFGVERLHRIRAALIVAGLEFLTDEDGFGVRLRQPRPETDGDAPAQPLIRPKLEVDPAAETPLTPAQCRAARAFLGWSQPETARALGLGLSTIAEFENASPRVGKAAAQKIRTAFARHGLSFSREAWRCSVELDESRFGPAQRT
jgi:transcriptional regulator with XRE-family HTH domain